jgi:signal transduction histidine kinase
MGIQRLAWEFSPVEGQEEYQRLCQIIRDEVARLNTIVQDFLTLARAPTPRREPVAIATLLQEVAALMAAEANARALVLSVQAAESIPSLLLDRQQTQQALINLVLNALQATPPGGTVQVTAAGRGRRRANHHRRLRPWHRP